MLKCIHAVSDSAVFLYPLPTPKELEFVSWGEFTMDGRGLTTSKVGKNGATAAKEWIASAFEVLGACRDPHGCGWGLWLQWKDPDQRMIANLLRSQPSLDRPDGFISKNKDPMAIDIVPAGPPNNRHAARHVAAGQVSAESALLIWVDAQAFIGKAAAERGSSALQGRIRDMMRVNALVRVFPSKPQAPAASMRIAASADRSANLPHLETASLGVLPLRHCDTFQFGKLVA